MRRDVPERLVTSTDFDVASTAGSVHFAGDGLDVRVAAGEFGDDDRFA